MRVLLLVSLLVVCVLADTLRFGITSVAIKDDLFAVREWANFLEKTTGRQIDVTFAKNYDEIRYLLENGGVDFAYVCGATFVEAKNSLKIIATPYINDSPIYYSLSIASSQSDYQSLLDFKGRHYAFSDPRSNSGAIVPTYELQQAGWDHRRFFGKVIHTYDHAESILAVAEGFVEGASVDSVVYENFRNIYPDIAAKVRVVERFGPFTATPVVAHNSLPESVQEELLAVLRLMSSDPEGRSILARFGIERFDQLIDHNYDEIAHMIDAIREHSWE